jgi:hypothetical protein
MSIKNILVYNIFDMGAQISRKMRMDRGFGNGSHKCPTLPPVQTSKDNAGLNGDISTSTSGTDKQQSVQLSGNTSQNSSAPLRGNVNQTQQMQQANISPLSVSASATKKFNFNGSNALIGNSSEYTIQPSSTLSNKNTKIILSWVDPKLSNQALPSIDCDVSIPVDKHLDNIEELIEVVNVIYVSYTDNNHIQLLLSGDICDNIYLVAENKLVMNLTAVDIKDINKNLSDNITVVSDLTDEFKKEKKPICEKMTAYFTDKMKTFVKIILLMNYCYLKLNSIKNGGLCYMPPDDDMDELDDNFNLFTPSSINYDKIEVYDNDLIDNNTLLKHIDKLNIREKLLLPDKNFATIRESVLEGQFEKYREKISLEQDKITKDKLQKIVENKKFITNIELIHEKDCKTNGGIFLKDANEIANYGLYSEDVSNTSWLNVYKTLCCSILDKLTKLKNKFIDQSFVMKKKEQKPTFGKPVTVDSWTDKDMEKDEIDALDKEITTEIEKIIIEIDRGFLGLYLIPTSSPARVKKEDEILAQAEAIKQKRGSNN